MALGTVSLEQPEEMHTGITSPTTITLLPWGEALQSLDSTQQL